MKNKLEFLHKNGVLNALYSFSITLVLFGIGFLMFTADSVVEEKPKKGINPSVKITAPKEDTNPLPTQTADLSETVRVTESNKVVAKAQPDLVIKTEVGAIGADKNVEPTETELARIEREHSDNLQNLFQEYLGLIDRYNNLLTEAENEAEAEQYRQDLQDVVIEFEDLLVAENERYEEELALLATI